MGRTSDRQRFDKHSDEYVNHRKKNNDAVKKSRTQSRKKSKDVVERIKQLTDENKVLEGKIKQLNDELKFLQNVVQEKKNGGRGASSNGTGLAPGDQARLTEILNRDPNNEEDDSESSEDEDEDSVPDFNTAKKNGRNSRWVLK